MCESVRNCDKLFVSDVGTKVQINEWAHLTVSGRMNAPMAVRGESYAMIETNSKGIIS